MTRLRASLRPTLWSSESTPTLKAAAPTNLPSDSRDRSTPTVRWAERAPRSKHPHRPSGRAKPAIEAPPPSVGPSEAHESERPHRPLGRATPTIGAPLPTVEPLDSHDRRCRGDVEGGRPTPVVGVGPWFAGVEWLGEVAPADGSSAEGRFGLCRQAGYAGAWRLRSLTRPRRHCDSKASCPLLGETSGIPSQQRPTPALRTGACLQRSFRQRPLTCDRGRWCGRRAAGEVASAEESWPRRGRRAAGEVARRSVRFCRQAGLRRSLAAPVTDETPSSLR